MKRRTFLRGGATILAAVGAGVPAPAADGDLQALGAFLLRRTASGLAVSHSAAPGRLLWETAAPLVIVEQVEARVRAFGQPEGAYDIEDRIIASHRVREVGRIETEGAGARVALGLEGAGAPACAIRFTPLGPSRLGFSISAEAPANRIRLRLASTPDEAFFGFGQQLTYFNQKGARLPILVQEHGVGRGRLGVTAIVDAMANHGGGTPYLTEAPAPHFISSRLRSMFLENVEPSVFDLRAAGHLEAKVWSPAMTGQILYGEGPLDLIEAYTEFAGRMRALPDWVHRGVIAGVQGGTQAVRGKLAALRAAGVPLAGLWIQDWTGVRTTSAGAQVWWNWELDEEHYPGWRDLVADLAADGQRMLVYVNPFLSTEPGRDSLFRTAEARGYLVRRRDGAPYLIRNTDFSSALLDLANPEARSWMGSILREELIGKAGASGWMADFGEASPFDAALHGGVDPMAWHNAYPVAWAETNRAAIEAAGKGEDIVFFNRSGFTRSPGAATLFWLGDQLQSWDEFDGIKSSVVGLMSGGVSGFSLLHNDVGDYVSLSLHLAGRTEPVIARSDELLQRWMELAAFTSVFRTHEGFDPAVAAQFDSSPANAAHLARFGTLYRALSAYRKELVADAARPSGRAPSVPALPRRSEHACAAPPVPARTRPSRRARARPRRAGRRGLFPRRERLDRPLDGRGGRRGGKLAEDAGGARPPGRLPAQGRPLLRRDPRRAGRGGTCRGAIGRVRPPQAPHVARRPLVRPRNHDPRRPVPAPAPEDARRRGRTGGLRRAGRRRLVQSPGGVGGAGPTPKRLQKAGPVSFDPDRETFGAPESGIWWSICLEAQR